MKRTPREKVKARVKAKEKKRNPRRMRLKVKRAKKRRRVVQILLSRTRVMDLVDMTWSEEEPMQVRLLRRSILKLKSRRENLKR